MRKNQKKQNQKLKIGMGEKLFFVLVLVVLILGSLNVAKAVGWLIPEQPPVQVSNKVVNLNSLTLEQKIGQMVIVSGRIDHLREWKKMQLGGVHFFALEREEQFKEIISKYQEGMAIPFFVTADLEGCLNPFANFKKFPAASRISTIESAEEKGREEGKFLASLGFNLNFAPVVDLDDQIWKCRSFPGNEEKITNLTAAYIAGLQQESIIATAKHYPGKTLVIKDPHKNIVTAQISVADVYPYARLKDVKSVMVSHIITSGAVDSEGLPAVVSPAVAELKEGYSGLIISDEINMLGLKQFYPTLDEVYIAVFKAGNDIVLNFNEDPNEIYHMIAVVRDAVLRGEISEDQIDSSVRKVLEAKGFVVVA